MSPAQGYEPADAPYNPSAAPLPPGGRFEREREEALPQSWELAGMSSNLITYLSLKLFMVR